MPQPTSKARLVITALFADKQTPAEVAARYGIHRAWVYKLKARYETEGDTALDSTDDEEVAGRPAGPTGHDRPSARTPGHLRRGEECNHRRPHRSLPHRATPGTLYDSMPKAVPGEITDPVTHDRIRHDTVDKAGSVTLRYRSRLHHIGIGRTHAGTCIILLAQDLQIRVVDAATGELLRELVLDPCRDYQPTGAPKGPTNRPPK